MQATLANRRHDAGGTVVQNEVVLGASRQSIPYGIRDKTTRRSATRCSSRSQGQAASHIGACASSSQGGGGVGPIAIVSVSASEEIVTSGGFKRGTAPPSRATTGQRRTPRRPTSGGCEMHRSIHQRRPMPRREPVIVIAGLKPSARERAAVSPGDIEVVSLDAYIGANADLVRSSSNPLSASSPPPTYRLLASQRTASARLLCT